MMGDSLLYSYFLVCDSPDEEYCSAYKSIDSIYYEEEWIETSGEEMISEIPMETINVLLNLNLDFGDVQFIELGRPAAHAMNGNCIDRKIS